MPGILSAGLHLVWPESAHDLVQRLAEARVPGIPRYPDTLADLLLERQLAIPCPLAGSELRPARTWRLAPAILAREQPHWLSFLRLAEPELLFSGVIPSAMALVEGSACQQGSVRSAPVEPRRDVPDAMAEVPQPPEASAAAETAPIETLA